MALGQADQLGDNLLQNRVMKQQATERGEDRAMREKMFNENVTARKDATTANNAWRSQNEDQQNLQLLLKANADGLMDDAGRAKANAWLNQHPQLSRTGIQLVRPQPKQPGTSKNAAAMGEEHLTKLQDDVAAAKESGDPKAIERALRREANYAAEKAGTSKPQKPESDARLNAAKKAAIDAELSGDDKAMQRAQKIIDAIENPPIAQPTQDFSAPDIGTAAKNFNTLTQSPFSPRQTTPPQPAPAAAKGDFVQPQDPDDSDMNAPRSADPQSRVDEVIREAQKMIALGVDSAIVIAEVKKIHGVTLTIK